MTPQEIELAKKTLKAILTGTSQLIGNLYSRWLEESEYEDIAEYGKVVKNALKSYECVEFIKMTKRPFGFIIKIQGVSFQFKMTIRSYSFKAI